MFGESCGVCRSCCWLALDLGTSCNRLVSGVWCATMHRQRLPDTEALGCHKTMKVADISPPEVRTQHACKMTCCCCQLGRQAGAAAALFTPAGNFWAQALCYTHTAWPSEHDIMHTCRPCVTPDKHSCPGKGNLNHKNPAVYQQRPNLLQLEAVSPPHALQRLQGQHDCSPVAAVRPAPVAQPDLPPAGWPVSPGVVRP